MNTDTSEQVATSDSFRPELPAKREQKGHSKLGALHAIAHSIAARGAMIGINAATGILTARLLAPQGRGELGAMIMWPVFLANAMTLGIPNALRYHIRRKTLPTSDLIGGALFLCLIANIVVACVVALLMPRILHLYPPWVVMYAQLFLLNAPVCILVQICRATFEATENFASSTQSQWSVPAFNLLGLIGLWIFHRFTPISAGYVYVFGAMPITIWLVVQLWRAYAPTIHAARKTIKILLLYGIRCYGIDLCTTFALYVDQTLVVGMLDASAMGLYIVALSLSRMISMTVQASVVMVLFPKAVGRSLEEIVAITGRAARMTTVCSGSVALVMSLLGPFLLRLLYGQKYLGAVPVFRVLLLEVVIASLTGVLAQTPMAAGRPGIVTLLQSAGLAVTIPLMFLLIPRFGILGAGIALLGSTICRLVLIVLSYPRFLRIPCPRLLITWPELRQFASHIARMLPAGKIAARQSGDGTL